MSCWFQNHGAGICLIRKSLLQPGHLLKMLTSSGIITVAATAPEWVFSAFSTAFTGPCWFPFLDAGQSPVLMDTVQKLGYQISMYTSASFSYPEFDKTVLVNVPDKSIHAYGKIGAGWERDRKNVGDLLTFIKTRNKKQPFFTFMFFESPHARYYFPPESIIRKNYLKDFNYATASLEKDIGLIKKPLHQLMSLS